ncbi:PH domain-containing protein [Clostridium sp. Marseille-P3244]|mgnify:CR=1 FL=1|uniref:PH domain-containing protein n=1 Tax=Clostridium sp. Marseille-P3244 TaxID=1871020 RepID=UPI00092FE47E|nr:PH domain-containing protein [Clostridium sp. Marseille-P3244]
MKSKIEKAEYSKLSKRALYCMYTADIITGAVILAAVAVLDYFWIFPEKITLGKWISLGLAVLILADVLISPYFRYHRYRYSINEECIDIIEGYLFVKRNIVPIERLHKLQTKRGPVDQMFGVEKVVVTTGGGDVTISFLEVEKAEQIAESLRQRINEIAAEQRTENSAGYIKDAEEKVRHMNESMSQGAEKDRNEN